MSITTVTIGLAIKNFVGWLWAHRKVIGIVFAGVVIFLILLSAYFYWFGASDEPVVDPVKQEKVSKLNVIAIEAIKTAEELSKREDVTDSEVRDAIKVAEDAQDDAVKAMKSDVKTHSNDWVTVRKKYCAKHLGDC